MKKVVWPILLTLVFQVGQVVAVFWTIQLLMASYGEVGFGHIQLSRQLANFSAPLAIFGLNVALVMRLAQHGDCGGRLLVTCIAGGAIAATATAVVFVVGLPAAPMIATIAFAAPIVELGMGLVVLVGATILYFYAYALLRGSRYFILANLTQLSCMGLIPALAAWTLHTREARTYVLAIAVAMVLWCMPVVALKLWRLHKKGAWPSWRDSYLEAKVLVKAGGMRMFSPALLGAIYLLPAVILNNEGRPEVAGYYLAAVAVLRGFELLLGSVAVVMLPVLSAATATGGIRRIRAYVKITIQGAVAFGFLLAENAWLHAEYLLKVLVGVEDVQAVDTFRWLLPALPFAICFSLMQTVADVVVRWAAASVALLAGLVASALCALLASTYETIPLEVCVPIAFIVASAFLMNETFKVFNEPTSWGRITCIAALSLSLTAAGKWATDRWGVDNSFEVLIAVVLLSGLHLFLIDLLGLLRLKHLHDQWKAASSLVGGLR